ncbi:InlB B-repeat-containing protein [Faecalibacterium prausnitzii]|uniref:InlB B-repeat-containing protein n=1 Tax=Faecalibacterium TaxID=216851 RepID=UPI0032EFEDFE
MKRNILARRAASAALAACMMFSLSAPALAASTDALLQQSTAAKSAVSVLDEENDMAVYQMNLKYGSIRVYIGDDGKQYAQQGENAPQQRGNLSITTNGSPTENTITIKGGTMGAKVTLSNVNIETTSNAAVSVSGNVELIIAGTNILRSGENRAGLEKADDDGTLTIDGTGSLEAYGGNEAAGIGSSYNNNVRNIVINGGTITAECTGRDGAGIGGGHSGKAENIRINGGVVTATGGEWGYGIGSGYNEYSLLPTTITITGGTVKAIAGKPGAAIGALASANDLTMTGGSLTVQKFENSWGWIISPSSTIVEVDKNSLTGAITYLNQDGKVEDTANWDITVNETAVNGVNYKDILGDGALCYDIEKKTLTAKERINYVLKVRAPETDVILNGGIGARSSLTIGQQGDSSAVGAHDVTVTSDRYDAIQGEADINCTGKVNIRSDKSMAVNGSLNIYDSSEVTLSAGSNVVNGSANITSNGNVAIYSTVGRAAEKLTINNAENVTISIRDAAGAVSGDTKITASGTVTLKNNAQGGRVGTVAFTQAGGKNYVYYTSEEPDAKLIDPRIHPLAEAAGSRYLRIEPRETYSITVKNGTAQVGDDTTGLTSAFEGEKVTVSGNNKNPSVTKFGGWKVISPEGFELTEEQKNAEKNMTFTMPASSVELKASYSFPAPVVDMPVIVTGGTIRVGGGERQTGTVLVQPGQTVTIEADEPAKENESFHHWKVEKDSSKNIGIIEGSLGSETEKGTEKIVFTMPQDGVKLTAVYSVPASVLRSTVTVTGGTAKSTLGEGSDIPAEIGTTVEITATPYDAEKYPGMEFVEWEIKYPDSFYQNFPNGIPENLQLKLDNAKSATTTFKMPAYPVKLIAHWSASAVADPDEPIDEDFGVEPAPMDTTGGTIAAVAVGGAAIWGGYEIATRVILHNLLPEGAAIPANRGQLALLIWTEKGKPEPAAQPAFADITDAEQAKAAQWCVEQGLLDAREGKFESDGWMPKFKTIEIWNKAFPKK